MREHHLQVRRTARYYVLGGPDAGEVWIVCHGYGQRAEDFGRRFEGIAGAGRLIVVPEALNRYYPEQGVGPHGPASPVAATWMTRDDREAEIDDYVEYLDRLLEHVLRQGSARPGRVVALGFSQGAATVSRWAMLGRASLDRLVLWGAGVPVDPAPEKHADRLRPLRPLVVAGSRDALFSGRAVEETRRRLERAGIELELLRYDGGHGISAAALEQVIERL